MAEISEEHPRHLRRVLTAEESEVLRTALAPYLLKQISSDAGRDKDYAELYDLLENEPDREQVLAAVSWAEYTNRRTGGTYVQVYRVPTKPQLYEFFVAAEKIQGGKSFVEGATPNIQSPLSARIFDLAWENMHYRSELHQLISAGPEAHLGGVILLVLGAGMLFGGSHWAEKLFGVMLLFVVAYSLWQLLVVDLRKYNLHVSRVESYVRKLYFMPHVTPIHPPPSAS